MSERNPLAGQTGIVTGAAKGLGLEITRRLAADGLHVVMADIDERALAEAAAKLTAEGLSVEASVADVTSEDDVRSMAARAIEAHGQVHVLVNNAGIYPHVPFDELTIGFVKKIFAVNIESAFLCSLAIVPNMKEHAYGRIVNFASGVCLNGVGGPAYVATKAANVGMTRAMARELGEHGITVNAMAPGLIETPGTQGLGDRHDELFEFVVSEQAVKRPGAPADIAEGVAYLVSPAGSFLTGQTLVINGGDRFH